ncbi:MAG: hypothetical protein AAF350_09505 [Pseudomonadota bacterium]
MSSGRELLQAIEGALGESRTAFRALDLEMQRRSAALGRTRGREASLYRQLAALRLADVADGEFGESMSRAERQAAAILDRRDASAAELNTRIDAAEAELAGHETEREGAATTRDEAALALDALLDDVDTKLSANPDYQQRVADVQQAIETAANAAAKTAEVEARRDDKRQPFDADPLFVYLWARRYGTPDYRANLIARFFDRLVARHVRYEPARRKYYALTEIPRRLRAHTARMEAAAETAAESLSDFERDADLAAGAEPVEDALEAAQARCDGIDATIEANESALNTLYAERDAFAEARDPHWAEAMALLDKAMRAEPIGELRREALMTPAIEDDDLVDSLEALLEQQEELGGYLEDHRDLHAKRARRVDSLSAIRRRYKSKRFDSPHSRIRDRREIEDMLAGFLAGLVTSDGLWRAIRHAQRFKRPPKTTSGGLPRGVKIRFPRSGGGGGSFGGGSFGGGGGFGGGGFSSSGGF